MKKIALIISSLTGGGAERVAINLCEYFNEQYEDKLQCDLIVLNNTGDYIYHGPKHIINKNYNDKNLVKKIFYHWIGYRWKLARLKKKQDYDQVISFASLANTLNLQTYGKENTIVSVRNYLSLNLNARQKEQIKTALSKS